MDIQELRSSVHLSASSINAYVECGLLYRLSRIDKCELETTGDALELGSVIHQTLADFNQERMLGSVLSQDELLRMFEDYWRSAAEENEAIEYREGKDFETLLDEGKGLLRAYHEKLPPDGFKILGIEEPFRFTVSGIPIIGVFDLIEEDPNGAIIVVDFKTSSKAYSSSSVDNNFQMTLYQMAAKACGFADREILLRVDVLIKTKKPKFEQYYTTRSEIEERRARKKIMEVWRGINMGVFVPNDTSWRCNGCGYKNYCEAWFEEE